MDVSHDNTQKLLDEMLKATHSWMAIIQELSVIVREKQERINFLEAELAAIKLRPKL